MVTRTYCQDCWHEIPAPSTPHVCEPGDYLHGDKTLSGDAIVGQHIMPMTIRTDQIVGTYYTIED